MATRCAHSAISHDMDGADSWGVIAELIVEFSTLHYLQIFHSLLPQRIG